MKDDELTCLSADEQVVVCHQTCSGLSMAVRRRVFLELSKFYLYFGVKNQDKPTNGAKRLLHLFTRVHLKNQTNRQCPSICITMTMELDRRSCCRDCTSASSSQSVIVTVLIRLEVIIKDTTTAARNDFRLPQWKRKKSHLGMPIEC